MNSKFHSSCMELSYNLSPDCNKWHQSTFPGAVHLTSFGDFNSGSEIVYSVEGRNPEEEWNEKLDAICRKLVDEVGKEVKLKLQEAVENFRRASEKFELQLKLVGENLRLLREEIAEEDCVDEKENHEGIHDEQTLFNKKRISQKVFDEMTESETKLLDEGNQEIFEVPEEGLKVVLDCHTTESGFLMKGTIVVLKYIEGAAALSVQKVFDEMPVLKLNMRCLFVVSSKSLVPYVLAFSDNMQRNETLNRIMVGNGGAIVVVYDCDERATRFIEGNIVVFDPGGDTLDIPWSSIKSALRSPMAGVRILIERFGEGLKERPTMLRPPPEPPPLQLEKINLAYLELLSNEKLSKGSLVLVPKRGGILFWESNLMSEDGFLTTFIEAIANESTAQAFISVDRDPNAQDRVKFIAIKHRSERVFQCAGPFQVLQRVGEVAYKLIFPLEARIYNVFQVSLQEKKVGDTGIVTQRTSYS